STNSDEVNICAVKQEKDGPIFKLHVRSRISYRTFILWADEVTYDSDSGETHLDGHVVLNGGPNDEHIEASNAVYNVRNETGPFVSKAFRCFFCLSPPIRFSASLANLDS